MEMETICHEGEIICSKKLIFELNIWNPITNNINMKIEYLLFPVNFKTTNDRIMDAMHNAPFINYFVNYS